MSFPMNTFFLRQLFLLTVDELGQIFLRKRFLLALILYSGLLLLAFLAIHQGKRFVMAAIPSMGLDMEQSFILEQALQRLSLPESAVKDHPILGYPLPLLIYFFISLFSLPMLIPMISCDVISQDLARGTQRFLLFRVSRGAYFWSKALAHVLSYLLLQASLLLLLLGVCGLYAREILSFSLLKGGVVLSLRLIPVILVFVAFTQAVSAQFSSPLKSLIVNNLLLLLMAILLSIKPFLSFFYSPLWVGLLSYDPRPFLMAVSGFLLWCVLFWSLSFGLFYVKKL